MSKSALRKRIQQAAIGKRTGCDSVVVFYERKTKEKKLIETQNVCRREEGEGRREGLEKANFRGLASKTNVLPHFL